MKENLIVPYSCDLITNLCARTGHVGHILFSADTPEENEFHHTIAEQRVTQQLISRHTGTIRDRDTAIVRLIMM